MSEKPTGALPGQAGNDPDSDLLVQDPNLPPVALDPACGGRALQVDAHQDRRLGRHRAAGRL